jgi:hypothetical protein
MKIEGYRDQIFGKRLTGREASRVIKDIQVVADESVKRFSEIFEIKLDFSEESLAELEKRLSQMKSSPTNLELVVTDLGCYLGEMLIRNLGGHWIIYKDLFHSAVAFGEEQSIWYHPFHKVQKRLIGGEEDSLLYFYQRAKNDTYRVT